MKANKKSNNPFKTPAGYLEGFDVRLPQNNTKAAKNIQQPFKVPVAYFEKFNIKKQSQTTPVVYLFEKHAWWAAAAALLLVIATPFLIQKNKSLDQEALSINAIDRYWDYATDALTAYDMAAYIDSELSDFNTVNPLSPSLEMYLESQIHPLETLELNSKEND